MAEKEYIEREALLKKAYELRGGSFATGLIIEQIEKAPSVDVVEIVKCKDCNHGRNCVDNDGVIMCILNSEKDEETDIDYGFLSFHSENHFCSYGEKGN